MVAIVLDFPSSPEVLVAAGYILDSADPTCTEEEVASLVESSLTEAAEFLAEAFEEAVNIYYHATGLTLSAADLTTGSVSTTTMAARVRRFGFQRTLFRA